MEKLLNLDHIGYLYLILKCYIIFYNYLIYDFKRFFMFFMGIGDWGLGIGPNPQSPIPNPQSPYIK